MFVDEYANKLRDNRVTNLVAKVLFWSITALWVMGLLWFSILLLPTFTDYLDSEDIGLKDHIVKTLLIMWYGATVVLLGASATFFAFKRIAWWVDEIRDDEEKK